MFSPDERHLVTPCSEATGDVLVASKAVKVSADIILEMGDQDKCPSVTSTKDALIHNKSANHDYPTACWASAGYASAGCAVVEQALRECMDGPKPPPKKKNNINYHLSRFKKYLEGNTKK